MADHADLKGRVLFAILALEGAEHNPQARALRSAGGLMRELWQAYERERAERARAVATARQKGAEEMREVCAVAMADVLGAYAYLRDGREWVAASDAIRALPLDVGEVERA